MSRYIHFLGLTTQGNIHDLKLLDIELLSKITTALKHIKLFVDLGYLGIKEYVELEKLLIPFKKPRKSKLNPNPVLEPEQIHVNKELASQRVIVEHVLAHIKRFNALVATHRNKNDGWDDLFIIIAAAIHNLERKY